MDLNQLLEGIASRISNEVLAEAEDRQFRSVGVRVEGGQNLGAVLNYVTASMQRPGIRIKRDSIQVWMVEHPTIVYEECDAALAP